MKRATHNFNKARFEEEMKARGWSFREDYHVWERPIGLTQPQAEAHWIESIIAALECPHEAQHA